MGGYQSDEVTSYYDKYGCPLYTTSGHIEFLRHEGIKQDEIVETLQKVHRDNTMPQPFASG